MTDTRNRNPEECLHSVRTIDFSSFEDLRADTDNACDKVNHCMTIPLEELNECNDKFNRPFICKEVVSLISRCSVEELVNRTYRITEQLSEQDSHCSSCDDVRHVEQDLCPKASSQARARSLA